MSKKLFVGSLPFSITEQALDQLFSEVGKVESAKLIIDRATGRSRGFGFVEMSTEEEAKKAIEQLNNKQVEGRSIIVNLAKPQVKRPNNY